MQAAGLTVTAVLLAQLLRRYAAEQARDRLRLTAEPGEGPPRLLAPLPLERVHGHDPAENVPADQHGVRPTGHLAGRSGRDAVVHILLQPRDASLPPVRGRIRGADADLILRQAEAADCIVKFALIGAADDQVHTILPS